jgi:integrase
MHKNLPKWPKLYAKKHRSGEYTYIVDAGKFKGKTRHRTPFKTLKEAKAFAQSLRQLKEKHGKETAEIALEKGDLLKQAMDILAPYDASVVDAAKYYEEHYLLFKESPTFEKIAKEHIRKSKRFGGREDTLRDLEQRLRGFLETFGKRRPSEISFVELRNWFQKQHWKPRNFINYRNKINGLFKFAQQSGWVDTNLVERIEKPKAEKPPPKIYCLDDCKKLLSYADSVHLLPYITIGLFSGVRPRELKLLDYSAVKLDHGFITIDASIAKARSRRNIKIEPVLKEWLELVPDKEGPVVSDVGFKNRRRKLVKDGSVSEWIQDGLRHSFASYHFAKFKNEVETSRQMGHPGTDVFHTHYKALVTEQEAEEFWNLTPSVVLNKN